MKKSLLISLILIFAFVMSACGKDKKVPSKTVTVSENTVFVYYPEGDKIVMSKDSHQLKQPDSIVPSVEEVMSVSIDYYNGKLENYSYMVDDDNNVTLEITVIEECSREYALLTMAAISDTLFQMDMVTSVKITLLTTQGETVDAKLILRNTFYHYASEKEGYTKRVIFYKADSDGQGLEALSGTLVMEDNVSMAENIVLKLEEIKAIPEGTKVNSLSIVAGVCYLDLSEEFEGNVEDTKSDLVVYALVNSLTDFSNINQVLITIDGRTVDSYRGSVDLSNPLSFNKEILK